ncbi:MAG: ethanolamine ammonia-lyase subunit EutC [Methylobacteriaceae bacterium]|jgi:ethanolamine ammonia-lyase small subunit|nr:ethanolamine ammonia-lyase subunit EutC [Methylobacteriaceae bacterium]
MGEPAETDVVAFNAFQTVDPWRELKAYTDARIALGRAGPAMPTREVLEFSLAHARARDAVHARFDAKALCDGLTALGIPVAEARSRAGSRDEYLRRPDLGRTLHPGSREALAGGFRLPVDIVLVICDGLSAKAVHENALPLVTELRPLLNGRGLNVTGVVVNQGRVAVGDEIGELAKARIAAVLIGERPGLSAADSLGVYLTYAPRPGCSDAQRNCISNIRAAGMPAAVAARKMMRLMEQALELKLTGVGLKDDDETAPLLRAAEPETNT